MKMREIKWENQTEPKLGMRCGVRARPLVWVSRAAFPSPLGYPE